MDIKPSQLPVLVVVYAVILAILGTVLGVRALFDPATAVNYIEGADALASAWAGRTLGLGLALALAIFLRSAAAYTVVFLGCVLREFGDIVGMYSTGETLTIAILVVFFLLDVVCLIFSARATRNETASENLNTN